jgi:sarcosine oxidase subunit gamma
LDHQANYLLPRQDSHACFQLSGEYLSEVMAKLCGVDLSPQAFGPGAVAQTSAARINVIVINASTLQQTRFYLLCDRASKAYFHEALLDAMQEFSSQPLEKP